MHRKHAHSGHGPRIAIIDSGVDPSLMDRVEAAVSIGLPPALSEPLDDVGHGSACAGVLLRTAPQQAVLLSVKVLARDRTCDPAGLAAALEWCLAAGADVVNVSLGCLEAGEEEGIPRVCAEAAQAGVIIVAAEHNDGLVSYPAHLPSVIGVCGGPIRGDGAYHYRPGQPIECMARGDLQRVRWRGGREVLMGGSSFAAPRIAGVVARLKARHPEAGLQEIRAMLRAGATRVIEVPRAPASGRREVARRSASGTDAPVPEGPPHAWIARAALYPYTKEMHAFIRFRDLLPFTVSGVADPPGRGLAGKDAGQALGAQVAGLPIRASLSEALVGADTLILGYVRQLGALRGRDLHREHVGLALRRGLNVFSFEPLPAHLYPELHHEAQRRGLRLAWPRVTREEVRAVLKGQPAGGTVDVPVVGVFGTSASQGKFTLQLALRRRLLELGYRVGQLGTEHHSALFGMDYAFPMGHGSTVEMGVESFPEFLDRQMRWIRSRRRPHLILVGSQSGTVPYDVHDAATLTLPTLAFLMGTRPDVCLLVVNAVDPDDYVADTVAALRAIAGAEVIGLAVSDRAKDLKERHGRTWVSSHRVEAEEMARTLQRLESRFGLPAVCITSGEGVTRICDVIIEALAAAPTSPAGRPAVPEHP